MKKILFLCFTAMAMTAALWMYAASRPVTTSMPAAAEGKNTPSETVDSAAIWADSLMAEMDLHARVAQIFVPRIDATDNAAGHAMLRRMVADEQVGGILLGKGTIKAYANMINYSQSQAKIPLLVTLDGEWGLAMRCSDAPVFPHNMTLGAIADERLLEQYGMEVARECREMGIHVNFAPVLDVNSNPSNPIIGNRSFGENPVNVTRLGIAYAKGLEKGGVISVAKHFPGHGDTSTDSHKTLPVVEHSPQKMDEIDLMPFKAYINAGMTGIMVGHLAVPALDPSGNPASLSAPITTDLLKGKLGFKGLVFTDALNMKGAGSKVNNCVRAIKAGADIMLGSSSPAHDISAVTAAVKNGQIKESDINSRCRKMLMYKYRLGLAKGPAKASASNIHSTDAETVIRRLSRASITLLSNDKGIIPVHGLDSLNISLTVIGAKQAKAFADMCRRYTRIDVSAPASAAKGHNLVIAAITDYTSASVQQLNSLVKSGTDVIAVFFINPYKISKFVPAAKKAAAVIEAYELTSSQQEAAAEAIFGGFAVSGRLPVTVDGFMSAGSGLSTSKTRLAFSTPAYVGMNPDMTANIDAMVKKALRDRAFPGCQVLVVKDGEIIMNGSYGTLDYEHGDSVRESTIYDLASITKATATAAGLMKAHDMGLFSIDDPLAKFVPETEDKPLGDVTLRELLLHRSGLPGGINTIKLMLDTASYSGPPVRNRRDAVYSIPVEQGVWGNSEARLDPALVSRHATKRHPISAAENIWVGDCTYDTIMQTIYDTPLRRRGNYVYSDLNFALLMNAEENMTDHLHDDFVACEIFRPLGAFNTTYRPIENGIDRQRIAPTENDRFLRKQVLHGYVHDELACFSGGVQGNAGLFSNALDLAKLLEMFRLGGTYGGRQIISPETVELFTRTRDNAGRRSLAFDLANGGAGSQSTYGHTGFTGTCFKIDPESGVIFIFLSNRVHPSRNNAAFARSDIRNKIWQEINRSLPH